MFSLRPFLIIGIVTLAVFATSADLHASTLDKCEVLFQSVKNVGAKTELQSQLAVLESRLAADGVEISDLKLSIRGGDRARVTITQGDNALASGVLRPSKQGLHAGRVSIEQIHVNFDHTYEGLNTITYLLLAREAIRQGFVLESSWDLTDQDRVQWSDLVKRGWAQKVDELFHEFDADFISAPEIIEAIDLFAERFSRP